MHNESQAERIPTDATVLNGNGVFADGETGIKFNKDESGVKFGLRFTNREMVVGVAAIVIGTLVGRKLKSADLRPVVAQTASKVQDVAEQAEEAANRG